MGWRKKHGEEVLAEGENIPENTPISDAVKMADETPHESDDARRRREVFKEIDQIEASVQEIVQNVHRLGVASPRCRNELLDHASTIAGCAEKLRDVFFSDRTLSDVPSTEPR